jgi:hypothetical protein
MKIIKKTILFVLFICIGSSSFAQKKTDENKPQNLTELKNSIKKY